MSQAHEFEIHPATLPQDKLIAECRIERTRRGGPGGQHRNKTESAVVILHEKSGVGGQAGERRSQKENRQVAIERLRINLALAVRTEKCSDSSTLSELWLSRASGKRISVSTQHSDFPAILAEALDWVHSCDFSLPDAAKRLQLSNSQLGKLLKQVPEAWQLVQRKRHELGLPRLK